MQEELQQNQPNNQEQNSLSLHLPRLPLRLFPQFKHRCPTPFFLYADVMSLAAFFVPFDDFAGFALAPEIFAVIQAAGFSIFLAFSMILLALAISLFAAVICAFSRSINRSRASSQESKKLPNWQ
jgi:hypothetical protein